MFARAGKVVPAEGIHTSLPERLSPSPLVVFGIGNSILDDLETPVCHSSGGGAENSTPLHVVIEGKARTRILEYGIPWQEVPVGESRRTKKPGSLDFYVQFIQRKSLLIPSLPRKE